MSETNQGERPVSRKASPLRIDDPALRQEMRRACVWVAVIGATLLAVYLSQSLLVIFGAIVFAGLIDGGARLLGRILPIARGWRVGIVLLATVAFLVWLGWFAGSSLIAQAAQFPELIQRQAQQLMAWAQGHGLRVGAQQIESVAGQLANGVGTITRAIGGFVGGMTTIVLILITGIYLAIEPALYQRGFSWLLPEEKRDEVATTMQRMGSTLRRLLAGRLAGMAIEGGFTFVLLWFYGVPLAALLGILVGLLAFIPNIGAIISGILMVMVGFSGGVDMGLYTIGVYVAVQAIDGYILVPMIAKRTVDLAPALVLAAQLIMGVLFGILGLTLADPLLAMVKSALERRAQRNAHKPAAGQRATERPPEAG